MTFTTASLLLFSAIVYILPSGIYKNHIMQSFSDAIFYGLHFSVTKHLLKCLLSILSSV